ncbi:hypothetical protein UT300019_11400 [Clostridium sp. CTA-19]
MSIKSTYMKIDNFGVRYIMLIQFEEAKGNKRIYKKSNTRRYSILKEKEVYFGI